MDENSRIVVDNEGGMTVACTADDRFSVRFSVWMDGDVRIAQKDAQGFVQSTFLTLEELEEIVKKLRPMRDAVNAKIDAENAYYEELEMKDWNSAAGYEEEGA